MTTKYAIIVAGGEGHRAGGGVPKQFREICGRPVVWWAARAFREQDPLTEIVMVVHPGFIDSFESIWGSGSDAIEVTLCCGGRSRLESVANGLLTVGSMIRDRGEDPAEAVVMIHDGARPLVDAAMISRGLAALRPGCGAIPGVKCVNSLRELLPGGERSRVVDRALYVEVQTPQIFGFATIRRAYAGLAADSGAFTDDASVAEAAGTEICLYEGDPSNIKVTHPEDFAIARTLLRMRMREIGE